MTLISCGIFAYAVNTIGNIFQELSKKNAEFRFIYKNLKIFKNNKKKKKLFFFFFLINYR